MRAKIALLWLCFFIRGGFYSIVFPVWEGFDEFGHFAMIQYLVSRGEWGDPGHTHISREVAASLKLTPLPWELKKFGPPHTTHEEYWSLPDDERARRQSELRRIPRAWAAEETPESILLWEAQQPPLYYWLLAWPLRWLWDAPIPERVLALRLISVLIASLVVPLGYLLARTVFAESAALSVVALVSLMPELMINISRVGNECLPIVLYTLLVWLCIRPGRAEWIGAGLGAGLLAKAYFVAAVPAVFLLFARARQAAGALKAFAVTMLLAGWWYWRNRQATGVWSGLPDDAAAHGAPLSRWIDGICQTRWVEALDSTLLSHLWFGNWSFLQVRSWMYHFFYLVIALAAAGLLWRLWRGARTLVPLILFYGFFWAALAYSVLMTYLARGLSATTGWYLYCLVIVEVIFTTAGLAALLPRRAHRAVLPAGAFCLMALELYATHFILIPYYTGLIAHRPGGGVSAFHLEAGARLGWGELIRRLCVNKPEWVTPEVLLVWWLVFLAATAAAFVITLAPTRTADSGMLDVK